jgi:16S rRNA (cytosine1402-N4)-methyltransferase
VIIDATLGMGGHAAALLDEKPNIRVLGVDRDRQAIEAATRSLDRFRGRVEIVNANFEEIETVTTGAGTGPVMGVLADLGVSSMQFDSETRGFSFRFDAPLDMRMDPDSDDETAADILATRSADEIADIIYEYGEERASRRIARRIVERRKRGEPVRTTKQLADLVAGALRGGKTDKIHAATRTFQALRIAVNREIEILDGFLKDAVNILDEGGILAVISFHSLEDRIVKRAFQRFAGKCICPPRIPQCQCGAVKIAEIMTKKPITPGDEELERNPRSRSAKLRAVKKLAK